MTIVTHGRMIPPPHWKPPRVVIPDDDDEYGDDDIGGVPITLNGRTSPWNMLAFYGTYPN
jgi:hypothetical protein